MVSEEYIRNRITQLRMKKNVSEYQMSLDLGHSKSYIQSISSGRALPSMGEFLQICEYLGVSEKDFFDEKSENPALIQEILEELYQISETDLSLMLSVLKRIKRK